jgi:hypothetical protein
LKNLLDSKIGLVRHVSSRDQNNVKLLKIKKYAIHVDQMQLLDKNEWQLSLKKQSYEDVLQFRLG